MQDLVVGEKYTLTFREKKDSGLQVIKRRMILVGKYTYHAVFMTKAGYTMSFTYLDLKRIMAGALIE